MVSGKTADPARCASWIARSAFLVAFALAAATAVTALEADGGVCSANSGCSSGLCIGYGCCTNFDPEFHGLFVPYATWRQGMLNCMRCGETGGCAACAHGMTLTAGWCVPHPDGYDCMANTMCHSNLCIGGGCCTPHDPDVHGDYNAWAASMQLCERCGEDGRCASCHKGVLGTDGMCSLCDKDDTAGCAKCVQDRSSFASLAANKWLCTECHDGYSLDSEGNCNKCPLAKAVHQAVQLVEEGTDMCVQANGYQVRFAACDASADGQLFYLLDSGAIMVASSGKCLDAGPGAEPRNWMSMRTWLCRANRASAIYEFNEQGALQNGWQGASGLNMCVIHAAGDLAKHYDCSKHASRSMAKLVARSLGEAADEGDDDSCSSLSGQSVQLVDEASGLCLQARGYYAVFRTCKAAADGQLFDLLANGQIMVVSSGRCLDAGPGAKPKNWMSLRTWLCRASSPSQIFTQVLPSHILVEEIDFADQVMTWNNRGAVVNGWVGDAGFRMCLVHASDGSAKHYDCSKLDKKRYVELFARRPKV